MTIRLHERRGVGHDSGWGLSCDEDGLRFAICPLIEADVIDGVRRYRRRSMEVINRILSAGYGAPVDLGPRRATLDAITEHLSKGEIGRAQIRALHLRLPDLADEAGIDRLLKADRLTRFNPNHDERGRFAVSPTGGGRSAKYSNESLGGTRFSTAIHLDAAQSKVIGEIIDYGVKQGFRPDQIRVVAEMAFLNPPLAPSRIIRKVRRRVCFNI